MQAAIQAKRQELHRRMAALEACDTELTVLLVACRSHESSGPCPVRWDLVAGEGRNPA